MADSIKLGNLDISSFKVGSGDCSVYLGDTLVYSGGTPPTPTGQTWVVYGAGDTIPTGVTFSGVRLSESTTIDTGAASFILTQSNYNFDFGKDYICANGECMSYPCIQYDCVDWDEETGECLSEECVDWDWGNCEQWQCTEWADGYVVSDNGQEIESGVFSYTDGYWTYMADMQSIMYSPLPFEIELLTSN